MSATRPLDGHHALVTGGGTGIGAAIAVALDRQGARITLLGRREPPLRETAARLKQGHWVCADVTDAESVGAAFGESREKQGTVSILVNNAGVARSALFERTSAELWRSVLDVNLTGVFHCTQAFLAGADKTAAGRIINIASTAGLRGYGYVSAYCAAKHGLIGLTRALALELAPTAITVNAVCPGYTETELVREAIANITKKTGRSEAEARGDLTRNNPQKRMIQPAEVAAAVAWLCLPESASVNGQSIAVDGGEVM